MQPFRNLRGLPIITLLSMASITGQETTGTITGLVTDATGGALANAEVTAVNTGTNASYKATTNIAGNYILRAVPVGNYRLTVSAPGFKRYDVANVFTQVNEITRVDVTMAVGAVSESIEVSAPAVSVNTEDASLRTVVDRPDAVIGCRASTG